MNNVREMVYNILASETSGHGIDHIDRVYSLALEFSKGLDVDLELVGLIALLHDVDDYKLFGNDASINLPNANYILDKVGVDEVKKAKVLEAIKTIGYSKYLKGIRPTTLEGMIVSDADMCDALGANGILRSYRYSIKKNRPFFDKDNFPIKDINYSEYTTVDGTAINHMFDKILKLKDLMMTENAKKEATRRHNFVVSFLEEYFTEEGETKWLDYLKGYLKENGQN